MEQELLKTAKKSIQDSGDAINDMGMGNKFTKINVIDIKVNLQTINIMVEESYKMRNTHIQVISYKVYSKEMEWLDIKLDKYLLEDLELEKEQLASKICLMAVPMKVNTKEMFPQVEDSLNGQMELNILDNGAEAYKMEKEYSYEKENRCEDYGKAGTGFAGSDKIDIFITPYPHFQKLSVFLTISMSTLSPFGLPSFISSRVAALA